MSARTICPDYASLEIPMDAWSEPFWKASQEGRLIMPRCTSCGTFRWPAGPFCPACHKQEVEWVSPGQGRVYSYTLLPVPNPADTDAPPELRAPVLVEFEEAKGVRLVSALIDAPVDGIAIGDAVEVEWHPAANAKVPLFRLRQAPGGEDA